MAQIEKLDQVTVKRTKISSEKDHIAPFQF